MRIVRAPRPSGFVKVPNDTARDKRLSFKARGLLTTLLSYSDGWLTDADKLAGESPNGRTVVLSGLRELVECGYVTYRNLRGEDGRFRKEMWVYDVPQPVDAPPGSR
ncbi:hypothetical protein [Actinomadura sp. 3N407]|uniref:hypothetical protein n=1 Tax=Actinomadura sp. 3N407 TaxID=3457423 RepID=UPI003FCE74AB